MLGIMAVLDKKDSYAFFPGSGMHQAGIAGALHLAMCLSLVGRPKMLGIMAGMNQTDILALFVDNGSCMVMAGFTGHDTPRACSCLSVGRLVMFGIMLCGGESFSPDDAYVSAWTALCR